MKIDEDIADSVHRLWDELADFDAAQGEAARRHLLARLCELTDSQNATWVGAVRLGEPEPSDPIKGWRARVIRQLHPSRTFERIDKELTDQIEAGWVDETVVRNVALAGQYRALRLVDLTSPEWFEGDFYRTYYLDIGCRDAIWAGVPINEDAECYVGLRRDLDHPPFGTAERDVVVYILRGLRWFHRQQMLREGLLVASRPLAPAEQRVLKHLLQGRSEKKIAALLELSQHTVHDYVKSLFRKFGVSSRSALMALWLGHTP